MFRPLTRLLVISLVSLAAGEARAQTCNVNDPPVCLSAEELQVCNAGTPQNVTCRSLAAGAACGALPCTGTACSGLEWCVGVTSCVGVGALFTASTTDDPRAGTVPCSTGFACQTQVSAGQEVCVTAPAAFETCSTSGLTCNGDFVVGCFDYAVNALISPPSFMDCSEFGVGFTCLEEADGVRCGNPACGLAQAGACSDSTAVVCSQGVVETETDCLTSGQVCIQDSPEQSPRCVTADPTCGPLGLGLCTLSTATICEGGQVVTTTDCSTVSRVCGPVDESGKIGCVIPGEGEGEGEGEPECERDSDCDEDETCEDGECASGPSGRDRDGGNEPAPAPTPLFSCQGTSVSGLGVWALLGVLLRRRRR